MSLITNINLDYNRPVKISEGVYWVGFHDSQTDSHTNPYLIIDGDEAIVIDSGSRSAFPTVIMKIMQTGITPSAVTGLVYQNYDPRICGSIPHFESIIDRPDLKIITDEANQMFIQHYSDSAKLLTLTNVDHQFRFSSGRRLRFIPVPYAHSAGSFLTLDEESGILFSGDMFSSYSPEWDLFMRVPAECKKCIETTRTGKCARRGKYCIKEDMSNYHRHIMTSERALKLALERVAAHSFSIIAPQHGSIIHEPDDIVFVCELLSSLKGVGIDGVIGNRSFFELGNVTPIKERFRDQ